MMFADTDWQPHPSNPRWIILTGANACVRIERMARGYLWQSGRRYGYAASIEEAKAWAVTIAEIASIPPDQRWITGL